MLIWLVIIRAKFSKSWMPTTNDCRYCKKWGKNYASSSSIKQWKVRLWSYHGWSSMHPSFFCWRRMRGHNLVWWLVGYLVVWSWVGFSSLRWVISPTFVGQWKPTVDGYKIVCVCWQGEVMGWWDHCKEPRKMTPCQQSALLTTDEGTGITIFHFW